MSIHSGKREKQENPPVAQREQYFLPGTDIQISV